MFDFEKLEVYQHVNQTNVKALREIEKCSQVDPFLLERWKNATVNILLNLSEGTGRLSSKDKNVFYTNSRSAVFESVAVLNLIRDLGQIDMEVCDDLYQDYERCSKMLLGMVRSHSQQRTNE